MQAGKRGPAKTLRSGCRLLVRGLPEGVKKTVLQGAFGEFGRIVKLEVPADKPGCAFIEYDEQRDASDALSELNGAVLEKHKISVVGSDEKPKVYTSGHPIGEATKADYVKRLEDEGKQRQSRHSAKSA
ncbi:unnamed protein product, partial [Polarella glacialis]